MIWSFACNRCIPSVFMSEVLRLCPEKQIQYEAINYDICLVLPTSTGKNENYRSGIQKMTCASSNRLPNFPAMLFWSAPGPIQQVARPMRVACLRSFDSYIFSWVQVAIHSWNWHKWSIYNLKTDAPSEQKRIENQPEMNPSESVTLRSLWERNYARS